MTRTNRECITFFFFLYTSVNWNSAQFFAQTTVLTPKTALKKNKKHDPTPRQTQTLGPIIVKKKSRTFWNTFKIKAKKKRRRKMKKNLVQSRTLAGPTDRVIRIDKGQCTGSFSKRRKKRSICADLYEMTAPVQTSALWIQRLRGNHAWITHRRQIQNLTHMVIRNEGPSFAYKCTLNTHSKALTWPASLADHFQGRGGPWSLGLALRSSWRGFGLSQEGGERYYFLHHLCWCLCHRKFVFLASSLFLGVSKKKKAKNLRVVIQNRSDRQKTKGFKKTAQLFSNHVPGWRGSGWS